jgi:hypothetical protein
MFSEIAKDVKKNLTPECTTHKKKSDLKTGLTLWCQN